MSRTMRKHFALWALLLAVSVSPARAGEDAWAEMFRASFREVPLVVRLQLTAQRVVQQWPGYVVYEQQGRVLETYKGPRLPRVRYWVWAERGARLPARPGQSLIACLTYDARHREYAVPDNGYLFPATGSMIQLARRLARRPIRRQ